MLAERLDWFKVREGAALVAIGGTIRNLASMAQSEDGYPLDSVDNYVLSGNDVQRIGRPAVAHDCGGARPSWAGCTWTGRTSSTRARSSTACCWSTVGSTSITVSRQGLREGLFYEKFSGGAVAAGDRGPARIQRPEPGAQLPPGHRPYAPRRLSLLTPLRRPGRAP